MSPSILIYFMFKKGILQCVWSAVFIMIVIFCNDIFATNRRNRFLRKSSSCLTSIEKIPNCRVKPFRWIKDLNATCEHIWHLFVQVWQVQVWQVQVWQVQVWQVQVWQNRQLGTSCRILQPKPLTKLQRTSLCVTDAATANLVLHQAFVEFKVLPIQFLIDFFCTPVQLFVC